MGGPVEVGWYSDPGRGHEYRYWNGSGWTADVSDRGAVSVDGTPVGSFGPPGRGDRIARWALALLLVGGAAALALSVAWGSWMRIGSTVDAADRVWGWSGALRALPAALVAWAVPVLAMVLAVRACRAGSAVLGRVVIAASGFVLFMVTVSVLSDLPETVTRDSDPGFKWLLLPVSIAVGVGATLVAFRAATHPRA